MNNFCWSSVNSDHSLVASEYNSPASLCPNNSKLAELAKATPNQQSCTVVNIWSAFTEVISIGLEKSIPAASALATLTYPIYVSML